MEFISYNNPDGSPQLNTKQIWSALRDSVVNNFGDVGWGAVGNSLNGMSHWDTRVWFHLIVFISSKVKYYSPVTGHCIIRVARDHYRIAWGATTLITSIDGKLVLPHVIHCSGQSNRVLFLSHFFTYQVPTRYNKEGANRDYTSRQGGYCEIESSRIRPKYDYSSLSIHASRLMAESFYDAESQVQLDEYAEESAKEIESLQD